MDQDHLQGKIAALTHVVYELLTLVDEQIVDGREVVNECLDIWLRDTTPLPGASDEDTHFFEGVQEAFKDSLLRKPLVTPPGARQLPKLTVIRGGKP